MDNGQSQVQLLSVLKLNDQSEELCQFQKLFWLKYLYNIYTSCWMHLRFWSRIDIIMIQMFQYGWILGHQCHMMYRIYNDFSKKENNPLHQGILQTNSFEGILWSWFYNFFHDRNCEYFNSCIHFNAQKDNFETIETLCYKKTRKWWLHFSPMIIYMVSDYDNL